MISFKTRVGSNIGGGGKEEVQTNDLNKTPKEKKTNIKAIK